ncbi:hypothetical protein SEUCBS140593_006092 [Sporothrix eucalyptigena]|uniref:ZZ-type domain-containing protein n=1 Tax=Sporothrix eucalyptigena TaxID=1812306 RepID=A0ABP0C479_9PEZI
MAPSTPVQPDTLITVKITLDEAGKVYKKAKVPFSVLTSGLVTFEAKLREFLGVEAEKPCHFERFSDSAGNHIPLVHSNPSVYRQLLRAAKAKQKLKLRVIYEEPNGAPAAAETESADKSTGPRPVTIEDVPEASSSTSETASAVPVPTPAASPVKPTAPAAEPTVKKPVVSAPPAPVPAKATIPAATPLSVLSSYRMRSQDYPDIPGHFPECQSTFDADLEKEIQASMQSMAQDQDLLDRNLSLMEASLGNVNLNAGSLDAVPAPFLPYAPYAPYSTYPYPRMESYNPYVKTPAAPAPTPAAPTPASPTPAAPTPAAPTPAVSVPNVSTTSTPQPIPVTKCTRDYPNAWNECRSAAASPDIHTDKTAEGPAKTSEKPKLVKLTSDTPAFTVCCNKCQRRLPNAHYHCDNCEGGDFDLCESCLTRGVKCFDPDHWLVRRWVQDGELVRSVTQRIQPGRKFLEAKAAIEAAAAEKAPEKIVVKPAKKNVEKPKLDFTVPGLTMPLFASRAAAHQQIRTCNNCIRELPEYEFLHCSECFDFDLCKACFVKNDHGHHPRHSFQPAVKGTDFSWNVTRRLSAGRGYQHHAVCDGCERFITGVRHKCSDCPDWDYCSDCVMNAHYIHPDHRFIPIYEPLPEPPLTQTSGTVRVVHTGIYCDGPHCAASGRSELPIRGDRYKCAVCNNKDFCATCEASPSNNHNKTHPLIKFRTPVRHVSVTTTGEHDNGRRMPTMGDQRPKMFSRATSTPEGAAKAESSNLSANKVQTVLDIKPTPASPAAPAPSGAELAPKVSEETLAFEPEAEALGAMFQRDTIADGTVFPPNHVFEQTWVLRNTGNVAWPAGCCVRFVSGDYMGHVDPNHPAGIQELVSASESTICYQPLAPGAEFPFTVLLRTPSRFGKTISYWRLTTKGGIKFGDRLWCDVDVQAKNEPTPAASAVEKAVVEDKGSSTEDSQMIFPKLEKESPVASIHEAQDVPAAPETSHVSDHSEFDEDWADDGSDGFMTDEEYDILDASDEESLAGDKLRK